MPQVLHFRINIVGGASTENVEERCNFTVNALTTFQGSDFRRSLLTHPC
jgi:hypothetical protein